MRIVNAPKFPDLIKTSHGVATHQLATPRTGSYLGRHTPQTCTCGGKAASTLHNRVTASMTRRMFLGGAAAAILPFIGFQTSKAIAQQPSPPDRPVLLTNLRLFDGVSKTVKTGVNILVEGSRIAALPSAAEAVQNAKVIDCGGRLAMPGLIDAHWHSMFCGLTEMAAMTADIGYVTWLPRAKPSTRYCAASPACVMPAGQASRSNAPSMKVSWSGRASSPRAP